MVHLVTTMLWSLSSNAAAACWTSSDEEHSKKQNVTTATRWRDVRPRNTTSPMQSAARSDSTRFQVITPSDVTYDTKLHEYIVVNTLRVTYLFEVIFCRVDVITTCVNWNTAPAIGNLIMVQSNVISWGGLYSGLVANCVVLLRNEYV